MRRKNKSGWWCPEAEKSEYSSIETVTRAKTIIHFDDDLQAISTAIKRLLSILMLIDCMLTLCAARANERASSLISIEHESQRERLSADTPMTANSNRYSTIDSNILCRSICLPSSAVWKNFSPNGNCYYAALVRYTVRMLVISCTSHIISFGHMMRDRGKSIRHLTVAF